MLQASYGSNVCSRTTTISAISTDTFICKGHLLTLVKLTSKPVCSGSMRIDHEVLIWAACSHVHILAGYVINLWRSTHATAFRSHTLWPLFCFGVHDGYKIFHFSFEWSWQKAWSQERLLICHFTWPSCGINLLTRCATHLWEVISFIL